MNSLEDILRNHISVMYSRGDYHGCYKECEKFLAKHPNEKGIQELYLEVLSEVVLNRGDIPTYFIHMMNDVDRIESFKRAIDSAINPDSKVLEIGGGTGIMSCLASRQLERGKEGKGKGEKVYCYEVNPFLAGVCRKVCSDNGCNVEVIEKMSVDESAKDIGGRKDVLICETIGNFVLSEHMIRIINHAHDNFLTTDATIIPRAAKLYGYIAESKINHRLFRGTLKRICDVDLSSFTNIIDLSHRVKKPISAEMTYGDQERLSDSKTLFEFDFRGKIEESSSRTMEFEVVKDGVMCGLVLHFDLEVSKDNILKSGVKYGSWDDHMVSNTSDFFVEVRKGQRVKLSVSYCENKVSVDVISIT